jgi:3-oxoacyl-[acyl-carrier protein] reductase
VTAELRAQIERENPLGRLGTPNDVADVVVFFASEQARWITGQVLHLGGHVI